MIIRAIEDIIGSEKKVEAPDGQWVSRRLLLASDGMGFSFHETIIRAGTKTHIHYKNHLESVYCIEGDGKVEDLNNGNIHDIRPGTIYILDKNDEHYLYGGSSDMKLMCVFNPAITGNEVHAKDGSYPVLEN